MKKVLSMFMALVMLMTSILYIDLSAYATISGDFMYEVISEEDKTCKITDYTGSATELSIPSTLGEYTVTTIGNYAFSSCESLTNITIPDSVIIIGDYAFGWCNRVTKIIIPHGVTTIGDWAFCCCSSLTSIKIPDSVASLGDRTFEECYGLTTVTIGNSVASIGEGAFCFCRQLTSIIIPDSVTNIGRVAFSSCNSLTNVTIPDSVTSIDDTAFIYCGGLTNITVDSNNSYYLSLDGVLFDKNKTELKQYPANNARTSYTIPDSVTKICDNAFYGSNNLTNITIGDSVTTIGTRAFNGCFNLTSVVIGNNVDTIEAGAFNSCGKLTSVTIGDSVSSIGLEAFDECDELTDVYYSGTTNDWDSIEIAAYNDDLFNATIHCIDGIFCYHDYNIFEIVEPTCTEAGKEIYKCLKCGETYTCTEETPEATGHNFGSNNPTCSTCGATNPNYVAPTASTTQPIEQTTQAPVTETTTVPVTHPSTTAPSTTQNTTTVKVTQKETTTAKEKPPVKGAQKVNGEWVNKKQKNASVKKLKKAKKSFKVYWKRVSGVKGYQIQYSTSKKFIKKTTKKVTVKGNKATSKTIKKLKGGKKYYIRVRTYKTYKVNKKTVNVYSKWSRAKAVTIKK